MKIKDLPKVEKIVELIDKMDSTFPNFIYSMKELIRFAEIAIDYLKRKKFLTYWKLEIGDFILIEKTEDVGGIIYNENQKGKIYVVLGVLNGTLHVKGINNSHWGYLHIEHVVKYKKLKYTELKIDQN